MSDAAGRTEQNIPAAQSRTPSAELLVQSLDHRRLRLATAESLTAGAVAARIAEVPGASAVLRGGVIAYCNTVKHDLLGVDADLLEQRGAVDPAVASAMARGTAAVTGADVGLSTTGVAGPEPHGGQDVGTVHLGLACRQEAAQRVGIELPAGWVGDAADVGGEPHGGWLAGSLLLRLDGDRSTIRDATVERALELVTGVLLSDASAGDDAG